MRELGHPVRAEAVHQSRDECRLGAGREAPDQPERGERTQRKRGERGEVVATTASPVSQTSGVAIGLTPRKCSENASVSAAGQKIGNCHHASVKGTWVAFHWRMAAISSGSYSSWMARGEPAEQVARQQRRGHRDRSARSGVGAQRDAAWAGILWYLSTIPWRGVRRPPAHPDRGPLRRGRPGDDAGRPAIRQPSVRAVPAVRGRRVLEVGSGIGTMSERLVDAAELVVGIEPNPVCAVQVKERMQGEAVLAARVPHRGLRPRRADVAPLRHRVLRQRARAHRRRRGGAADLRPRRAPAATCWCGCLPCPRPTGRSTRNSAITAATPGGADAAFTHAGLEVVSVRYSNPIGLLGWMYNAHVGKSRRTARRRSSSSKP